MSSRIRFEEAGRIGDLAIRNRIVMAPMISNLANPDGSTNETHISYLRERAIGGTGLIITEYTYVDNVNSKGSRNELGIYSTDFIPKLRRLTEIVHNEGSKIFIQLVHAGGKALEYSEKSMAPSSVNYQGKVPREMKTDDIERVTSAFARAAKTAERANFDGIELHGAHGYLLQEFISPSLNRRTDKYGGDFDNRIRFPQEVIDAVKSEIKIPVGIRLSLYEDDPDGYGPEYGLRVAESLKGIDYVHFSAGRFAAPGSSASFYSPKAHIYSRLPRKPRVTSIVVGSVTSLEDVNAVLERSDFVSVGRGLLADPHFVKRLSNGKDIRPCIRCNQACRDLSFGEVRCTVNVDLGFERMPYFMGSLKGEISIIGGGVKGIEAAITAARAGLKVALYEQRERIGGQILDIYDPFKKKEFHVLLNYYENVLKNLGIEMHINERYTGKGLYCLPDVSYGHIPGNSEITINSNIYQHHDEALSIAKSSNVKMTRASLSSLDRARAAGFELYATSIGIRLIDSKKGDINIIEKDQYDIRKAIISGRRIVMEELRMNSPDYL
ncbi:MAG: FAD-dependent oxidoreductase [Thermoplasmatales archaeon]|nr:FAD-dependent oxidoreductase [Thermoplasmatales archaeon]MCW6170111.1 FAD-dependent oxidoreductase [Thermoplasmatales archaeon]